MDKKTNSGSLWGAAFAVASVWFGTHVGGGFAIGNQTVQYFVGFGWPAVFMPTLIILLLDWCYYNGSVMAKNHKVFRYDEFAAELYAPFSTAGKVDGVVIDETNPVAPYDALSLDRKSVV